MGERTGGERAERRLKISGAFAELAKLELRRGTLLLLFTAHASYKASGSLHSQMLTAVLGARQVSRQVLGHVES